MLGTHTQVQLSANLGQSGLLHTRDWEPVTSTFQALSSVEKAELVEVRFTLRLRDQRSMWLQDACKVYMHGFLHGIEWIMFHGHLDYFQKPLLGGRPNTKPGDHGTPNAHNHWFFRFYHVWGVWGPTWINFHWNSIGLKTRSHVTSHYTWGSVTTLHDFGGVLRQPLETLLLGCHNSMVTALGSCVKWPLDGTDLEICEERSWKVGECRQSQASSVHRIGHTHLY
jgi:hypothetical protein